MASDSGNGGSQAPRTRQKSSCKMSTYVGVGKDFSMADVPTNRAVIQRGLLLKEEKEAEGLYAKNYPVKAMSRELAPLVEAQWLKANAKFVHPVTNGRRRLEERIEGLWNRVLAVAQGRGKAVERASVLENLDRLFDIVHCSHAIFLCLEPGSDCTDMKRGCEIGAHIKCSCPKDQKVPVLDLQWLRSQRDKRGEKGGMQMSLVDQVETKKQRRTEENKAMVAEASAKRSKKIEEERVELEERAFQEEMELTFEEVSLGTEEVFQPACLTKKETIEVKEIVDQLLEAKLGDQAQLVTRYLETHRIQRNYMPVPTTAAESLRFEVSPAAAAAVASGFLRDLIDAGHLSKDKSYLALDPSKVRRARESVMLGATKTEDARAKEEIIEAIYYDGRKDKTRAMVPDPSGRLHPRLVKEEHVSVTAEPSGRYLSHFTPEAAVHPDKPAKKVAEGLFTILDQVGATETCNTLGGDSYNGNTGWKGGSNAHLERMLGHKCHWCVCSAHTNELPLRHLIEKLDGKTCSKDGFTGPIGKLLGKVMEMELDNNFKAMPGGEDLYPLPEDIMNSLSTDACVSYKYVQAIKAGVLPTELAELKPGPIVHSRWLTTGEALLFMWTRKHGLVGKDKANLETLVSFCIKSYFKLYFDIKVMHHLIHGPYHVLTQLRILQTLPKQVM